ncbi:uncharacterized protein LOC126998283 [Eriocheir sinensis]|uniref:uncharacterized protein LOC126998283 n=1 Tax=Eriocheir sinensis TaxID=95602 RepID=UPI0021C5CC34|nr:uncharacterized protein LOC126998283 [Eriocheir sinensis]
MVLFPIPRVLLLLFLLLPLFLFVNMSLCFNIPPPPPPSLLHTSPAPHPWHPPPPPPALPHLSSLFHPPPPPPSPSVSPSSVSSIPPSSSSSSTSLPSSPSPSSSSFSTSFPSSSSSSFPTTIITTTTTTQHSHVPPHILALLDQLQPYNTTTTTTTSTTGCLPPLPRSATPLPVLSLGPISEGFQYAVPLIRVPSMQEFTICLRFQAENTTTANFLLSYATRGQDNAMVVFVSPSARPGVGVYVNNQRAKGRIEVLEGVWYGLCVSWAADTGKVVMFVDGEKVMEKKKCTGCEVAGDGVVVIGVEQDTRGGGFKAAQVSHALVTSLNLWATALPYPRLVYHSQCFGQKEQEEEEEEEGMKEEQLDEEEEEEEREEAKEEELEERKDLETDEAKKEEEEEREEAKKEELVERKDLETDETKKEKKKEEEEEEEEEEERIISWGKTPLAVMGGALLIPLLPP